MLQRAEEKYRLDENYRRLYDTVAKYFARGLERERNVMEQGESNDFGGYAKWAPSLKGSHNRHTDSKLLRFCSKSKQENPLFFKSSAHCIYTFVHS